MYVVDYKGNEVGNDVISLSGYEAFTANDYSLCISTLLLLSHLLGYLPPPDTDTSSTFYITSPKDIVIARPRDIDDHIQWLVDHEDYEQALKLAEIDESSNNIRRHSAASVRVKNIMEIGQKWLQSLLDESKFQEAAENVPKILRGDKELWERWFFVFAEARQIPALFPHIPVLEPKLSSLIYELILAFFMNTNQPVWPLL